MNLKENLILKLIDATKVLGLAEIDLNNAKELLFNNEYHLAFDTIIIQLYEYEIKINLVFYNLIEGIARSLELSEKEYFFMKELIKA